MKEKIKVEEPKLTKIAKTILLTCIFNFCKVMQARRIDLIYFPSSHFHHQSKPALYVICWGHIFSTLCSKVIYNIYLNQKTKMNYVQFKKAPVAQQ